MQAPVQRSELSSDTSHRRQRSWNVFDPRLPGDIGAFLRTTPNRLPSSALCKNHFWHNYVESAIFKCCFGLRGINRTGQIDDVVHHFRVPMRMRVLFRFRAFTGLGYFSLILSRRGSRLTLILLWNPRNFGACGKLFARFREVNFVSSLDSARNQHSRSLRERVHRLSKI